METTAHHDGRLNGGSSTSLRRQCSNDPIRIAYLISRYPAVSHTFILREVEKLRNSNFEILVASINSPDRSIDGMTSSEQDEVARTFYVKRGGALGAARAHLGLLLKSPKSYFKGLWFALRLAGTDLRRLVFAVLYFVEAVM